jgi:hypothetical protein
MSVMVNRKLYVPVPVLWIVLSLQGNILLATAMAHKFGDDGLLSFSVHPGSVKTVFPLYNFVNI